MLVQLLDDKLKFVQSKFVENIFTCMLNNWVKVFVENSANWLVEAVILPKRKKRPFLYLQMADSFELLDELFLGWTSSILSNWL